MVTLKPDYFQEGHQVLPKIFLDISGAGRGKKEIHVTFQNCCDNLFIFIPNL